MLSNLSLFRNHCC